MSENVFLQNLPKADTNREIQTNSFDALNIFLPKDKFCFRDERTEDYGVDGSLEILENECATNFRAQAQLKGTRSLEPNKDGSYSLQVETYNLNYLLNNPISLYILYIEPKREFRFVWAKNEFQRLEKENPNWMEQKTITLRFEEILDTEKLNYIRGEIIKHSVLNRSLSENLLLSKSPNVVIEINSDTFEITDKAKILKLIDNLGISLINEGSAKEILQQISLLDTEDRDKSSVMTVKAYAEYYLGHYRTSKEIISLLKISGQEISQTNQQIMDWLGTACDYHLGNIESKEYIAKLGEIAKTDDLEEFSSNRFNYIRYLLLDEEDLLPRKKLFNELKNEIGKFSLQELAKEYVLLFRFIVSECEVGLLTLEFGKSIEKALMKATSGIYSNITSLYEAHQKRATKWNEEFNEIFNTTENEILRADLIILKILLHISEVAYLQHWYRHHGLFFDLIKDDAFDQYKQYAEEAIKTYKEAKMYERELRAETHLAELLYLKGQIDEANGIFSAVSKNSTEMSYVLLNANSENPLSKAYERVMDKKRSTEWIEEWTNDSDDDLEKLAQAIVESLEIPQERISNVKKDCFSKREINREKIGWCENIELQQDLNHTRSLTTYYAKDLEFFGHCVKHKYSSILGNSDYQTVISAFKKTYCENCPDRKPM